VFSFPFFCWKGGGVPEDDDLRLQFARDLGGCEDEDTEYCDDASKENVEEGFFARSRWARHLSELEAERAAAAAVMVVVVIVVVVVVVPRLSS
jgi:hypothetical protein